MMNKLLAESRRCYAACETFRRNRRRCRDYTFGRQWNDPIHVKGKTISERQYIIEEGNFPLINNLIRRVVRNVLGVYHKRMAEEGQNISHTLRQIEEENRMQEIYARTMEEFVVSGMAVHRKWFGIRHGKTGVWTDMVNPSTFFFNRDSRDVRGWDVRIVGQIHDVCFSDWCSQFVKSQADYKRALSLFEGPLAKRRVMEVWRKEPAPCRFGNRWYMDHRWRYYFLDHDGSILRQGDSPYEHGGHPYIFKAYPFLDGEIHSFVGDIIDQQRYTNRLITLYDWVIRASAKGVLLIPDQSVPMGKYEEIKEAWSKCNGVITYSSSPDRPEPHQVLSNSSAPGISDLLSIQLKMLEDVSGVNATLQGNLSGSSVSGALFNQQTENALTSLTDLLDTFFNFIDECRKMDLTLYSQSLA